MKQLLAALACAASLAGPASAIDRLVPSQYPTIQAAIDAANQGDVVVVSPGIYPEGIDFDGKAITVRGTEPNDQIIIEPPAGPGVLFTSGEGPGSVLEQVTIRGGDNALGGGAVFGVGASPTLDDVSFTQCNAVFGAGAVINSGASPHFTFCGFSFNDATFDGGGVACLPGSSPTFENCVFRGNDAGADGGAMHIDDADVITTNCNFSSGNSATNGGAIAIEGGTLDYVGGFGAGIGDIRQNRADANGGGIYATDGAVATFLRAHPDDNSALGQGGGVFVTGGASVTMTNGRIVRNTATDGAGACVVGGEATFVACRFESNDADSRGGGLLVFSDSDEEISVASVVQSGFERNSADHGAAISARSLFVLDGVPSVTLNLSNSIIYNNFALDPAGSGGIDAADAGSAGVQTTIDIRSCTIADNTGGVVNGVRGVAAPGAPQIILYNSIVWGNENADFASASVPLTTTGYSIFPELATYPGPGNLDADPMFSDEAFALYDLAPGSPARDAGSNALAATDVVDADDDGDTAEPLPRDYSNSEFQSRFVNDGGTPNTGVGPGDVIDIGAQEAQEGTPCTVADIVVPGALNFDDVLAFLNLFNAMHPAADLAPAFGVWDFSDVLAFLTAFAEGCPG